MYVCRPADDTDDTEHLVLVGGTQIYEMYGVGTIHTTPLFLKTPAQRCVNGYARGLRVATPGLGPGRSATK